MAAKSIKLICRKCGLPKSLSEMRRDKRCRYGRDKICHECANHQVYWSRREQRLMEKKEDYQKRKSFLRQRQRDLKYGLKEGQYDVLFQKQNGLCAICSKAQEKRPLSVDHCHKTKKVRGLLCDQCNMAIGKFKDDEKVLLRAIRYLMKASPTYADRLEY